MKGIGCLFDYINLLYYKCHKINLNRGISLDWIKKAAINPVNKKNNKCFQFAVTVALNHEEIGKHSERITKIKSFINIIQKKQIFHQKKMIGKKLKKIM